MADFSEIPWIKAHTELYQRDPEKARMWDSSPQGGPGPLPTLLLTTIGRKTGKPRALPLLYGEAGESFVIIASKGGTPDQPVWYLNLAVNPECDLMVGVVPIHARARVAEGEEREHLWKQMEEMYPPYTGYQKKAGERVIPVVVLDPVS